MTRRVVACLVLSAALGCSNAVPLPPRALELNRLGAAALGAGDLETAEVRLALALEYSPKFTEAWVNLGLVELRAGNIKAARKDLTHARSLNEDLPAPHHALGLLEEEQGRMDQAEKHYRAALRVDPGFAASRVNLARMLFAQGRVDESREQFERLTEVAPDAIDGWVGLVEAFLRLGRESDADHVTGRARARFGDRPELVLLVARQLLRRGAFAEVAPLLAPLTALDGPRAATAWAWIAVARLGAGDRQSARDAALEALGRSPRDPVATYVLAASGGDAPRLAD
jgi:tetratricopeptide (TPR) repeat protein